MRCTRPLAVPTALLLAALSACGGGDDEPAPGSPTPPAATPRAPAPASPAPTTPGVTDPASPRPTATGEVRLGAPQAITTGLAAPWGLAFLPGGDALVSERDSGRILRVPAGGGAAQEVDRVEEAEPRGEGGLLGIAVGPTYDRDALVYAYYSTGSDNRVVRFRLGEPPEPIITGIPVASNHNGGRLAFGPDGMLYVSTGDAQARGSAQDPGSLGGKILRVTPEGRPAPGNPTPGSPVYSLGHRNVQGLAWDDQERLYATEFGQNTLDEVNLIVPGGNYGWPDVEGTGGAPRFRDPVVTWPTREASPSGMAYANGSLWVAALRGERLWRVRLDASGGAAGSEPLLVGEYGRLRHAALAPGGDALWVLTSNRDGRGDPEEADDRVLRIPLEPVTS